MLENQLVNLIGLVKLRWASVIGGAIIFLAANLGLDLELSWVPLVSILTLAVFSNITIRIYPTRYNSQAVIVLDILLLTALLFFYGGYTNPFSMVYFVYLTIAAFFLGRRWTWFTLILSTLCFASLFLWYRPVAAFSMHEHHPGQGLQLHLQGMLLAFALIGVLLSYFITKMSAELDEFRSREFSENKLAAIASLTAGTAHELATPLNTVYLISEELTSKKHSESPISTVAEDISDLHTQVLRAKNILTRMRARSPDLQGETHSNVDVAALIEEVLQTFTAVERSRVRISPEGFHQQIAAQPISLREALTVLIKNALEASGDAQAVELSLSYRTGTMIFDIRDYAKNIADDDFNRMGEPFFTTKPVGQGMGLGLYLVKAYAAQAHGSVMFYRKNPGMLASLTIPG